MQKRTIKNSQGFTLIEMIMVMLFIAIAFLSILYVFTSSMRASTSIEGEIVAMNLANQKMEELLNRPFSVVTSEAKLPVANFSRFYRKVDISTLEANLKKIDITVYWQVENSEVSYNLISLKSNVK
jgi:type II secretion system protein I